MSSRLNTSTQKDVDTDTSFTDGAKRRKRSEFESETSADEDNTDNEMTFIKNPQGSRKDNVDYNGGNMSFLSALDVDESDSENENGLMDKLATAMGHLFTE